MTTILHTGSLACFRSSGADEVSDLLTRLRRDGEILLSFDPNITVARHWATLGGDGAFAVYADQELRRAAPPIEVVDTVGAGDAFTAGLLSALRSTGRGTPETIRDLECEQLAAVIDRAIHVASLTCTRAGADTPRQDDLYW